MAKFFDGVRDFQDRVFPDQKALFESLADGQHPDALFVTCSDSRIETAMLTQSKPGDLFVCRNAGNIIPPHKRHTGGITATLEYAMKALAVPHIVICGHTGCGAMEGVMHPELIDGMSHVQEWLGFARKAKQELERTHADSSDETRMQRLTELNVELQLSHLRSHPSVSARLKSGDLTLHGWVYDISTGRVTAYDEDKHGFVGFDEKYG